MNIQEYNHYFLNNSPQHNFRIHRTKKNNLSNDFDKLFFNFLIIIKYDIPVFYNRTIEKKIKYEISHKLENFKFKLKNKIIENLCFEDNINLYTLYCLSNFFNLNLFFFKENIFFKMFSNDSEIFYLINSSKDIYLIKKDKIDTIINENYEITDINKPMYGLAYYKVNDLELIREKLNIKISEKYKKNDLYDLIKKYLTNIINY